MYIKDSCDNCGNPLYDGICLQCDVVDELEMIQLLFENPKRKAKLIINTFGEINNNDNIVLYVDDKGYLCRHDTILGLQQVKIIDNKSKYLIVESERKLKDFTFTEAFIRWAKTDRESEDIYSAQTGETFVEDFAKISEKAYRGKWYIKGEYENYE